MGAGRLSDYDSGKNTNSDLKMMTWHFGRVMADATKDPLSAGRIKVFIPGIDNDVTEARAEDLAWCNPLLPKFFNISPKEGETVKVFFENQKNKKIMRFFIGPVISQPQRMGNDPEIGPSRSVFDRGNKGGKTLKSYKLNKEYEKLGTNWRVYPNEKDISIIGRGNQDIILREKENFYDEIIFRVGKHKDNTINGREILNKKNPSYISLTFLTKVSSSDQPTINRKKPRGHINIVSDQINLISHKGSQGGKGLPDPILNSDDSTKQIFTENNKLHPLVYGDKFWEFVILLEDYVRGHIHEGSRLPSDDSGPTKLLLNWIKSNKGDVGSRGLNSNSLGLPVPKKKKNPDGTEYPVYPNCRFLSTGVKIN